MHKAARRDRMTSLNTKALRLRVHAGFRHQDVIYKENTRYKECVFSKVTCPCITVGKLEEKQFFARAEQVLNRGNPLILCTAHLRCSSTRKTFGILFHIN